MMFEDWLFSTQFHCTILLIATDTTFDPWLMRFLLFPFERQLPYNVNVKNAAISVVMHPFTLNLAINSIVSFNVMIHEQSFSL